MLLSLVMLDVVMAMPVALLADVLLTAPLVSIPDARDLVLPNAVLLDVAMLVPIVPLTGVLLDALLVSLADVRHAVLQRRAA